MNGLKQNVLRENSNNRDYEQNPFSVGQKVYLRVPDGRCSNEWSGPHRVTKLQSDVSVILDEDGVTRHVSHLRKIPRDTTQFKEVKEMEDSDNDSSDQQEDEESDDDISDQQEDKSPKLFRSTRIKQKPDRLML